MPHKDWRERWDKNRERMLANQRAYTARNREAINARLAIVRADPAWRERKRASDRARYAANPGAARASQVLQRYGLSGEALARLTAEQGGRCAVCEMVPSGKGKKSQTLHVDHDHATGIVRGLLCDKCNRAIGLMGDSATTLTRAAMYLVRVAGDRRETA